MNAVWVTDYDFRTNKCFKRPGCPKCKEPAFEYEEGVYRCVSCGEVVDIVNNKMKKWIADRKETKTEYQDCPKWEHEGKTFGCGGEKTMEVHYMRNPVTLKWQSMGGCCKNCGMRWLV